MTTSRQSFPPLVKRAWPVAREMGSPLYRMDDVTPLAAMPEDSPFRNSDPKRPDWARSSCPARSQELAVSELVSNALQAHRRERLNAPIRITLLGGLRTVLIVVRDASDRPPATTSAAPDLDSESGRGLCIVDVLSSAWCCKPTPGGGKSVRALLRASRGEIYRKPV